MAHHQARRPRLSHTRLTGVLAYRGLQMALGVVERDVQRLGAYVEVDPVCLELIPACRRSSLARVPWPRQRLAACRARAVLAPGPHVASVRVVPPGLPVVVRKRLPAVHHVATPARLQLRPLRSNPVLLPPHVVRQGPAIVRAQGLHLMESLLCRRLLRRLIDRNNLSYLHCLTSPPTFLFGPSPM
eukprot:750627-Hanusia_phi.AAC.13